MRSSRIAPDQEAIVVEVEVTVPPERVFRALIDPAQLWWGDDICQTSVCVVNGVSDFKAYGEITECDPPRAPTYTWLGNWHDHAERPSMVRAGNSLGDQER
jgi:uncharacterized protein YndB with AHSA1/START domain